MAKKVINSRCPLANECERKTCDYKGHELDCIYYNTNGVASGGIPDQEEIRTKRFNQQMEELYQREDIIADARAGEIAMEINIIKRDTAEIFARNSIKIGQRLKEVKELLPFGSFENWLEKNVDYSLSTAQRFMKLADVYEGQLAAGDEDMAELFASMLPSKALVLAQLAPAQQKKFVKEHNTNEMSVREMKAAVKAKEEAEKKAAESEKEKSELQARLTELEGQLQEAKATGEISPEERARIEQEAKKAAEEAAAKKIEAAKKKAEKDLEKARAEGAEAVKKVEAKNAEAIKAAKEEAKAEAEKATAAKIAELEEQIRAQAAQASPYRVRFGENLEGLKAAYGRMVAVVEEAERNEPEEGQVLREILNRVSTMLAAE